MPSQIDFALLGELRDNLPREPFPADCCVVTASDKAFFPGIQLMYASLVAYNSNVRVVAFDFGWTPEQTLWAISQPGISIRRLTDKVPDEQPFASQYNRPFYIKQAMSEYGRVVWVDCDCIVRHSVNPIFNHLNQRPFIIQNQFCTPNDRRVYDLIPRCSTKEAFSVSSGVFGVLSNRDFAIVDEWIQITRTVTSSDAWKWISAMKDEAILRIVVQKLNLFEDIWWDMRWNAIHHDPATRGNLIQSLTNLRQGDYITHFYGTPKIWQSTGLDVINVNPHWRYPHV